MFLKIFIMVSLFVVIILPLATIILPFVMDKIFIQFGEWIFEIKFKISLILNVCK